MLSVSACWINVLEREGWLVVNVNDRKVGIIVSVTEAGKQYLKIAGFHLGESMLVGERQNVLADKVEQIQEENFAKTLAAIKDALPIELQELPIAFMS
jgi:DNA-binding PadR family transcriptional regulator